MGCLSIRIVSPLTQTSALSVLMHLSQCWAPLGLVLQQQECDATLLQGMQFASMGQSLQKMSIFRWAVERERKWELSLFTNKESCEDVRVGVHCNAMAILA